MATMVIGNRECELRKPALKPYEAAYVLRCSERDAHNMLRRGERYQQAGLSPDAVVDRGALPVTLIGGRRRAEISGVVESISGDLLALAVLGGLVEGRIVAPRAADKRVMAPDLLTSVHCL